MKTLGVGDVSKFELVTYPHEEAYAKALEQLYALKVIDNHCNLTSDIGLKITDFNLETKLGVRPFGLYLKRLKSFNFEGTATE